jgi:hypothetical protein
MPLNPMCCENAQTQIVKRLIPLLHQYVHEKKHNKDTIELIKALISINIEFKVLLDIYLD